MFMTVLSLSGRIHPKASWCLRGMGVPEELGSTSPLTARHSSKFSGKTSAVAGGAGVVGSSVSSIIAISDVTTCSPSSSQTARSSSNLSSVTSLVTGGGDGDKGNISSASSGSTACSTSLSQNARCSSDLSSQISAAASRASDGVVISGGAKRSNISSRMDLTTCSASLPLGEAGAPSLLGKQPILLLDVMGTIVRDPFYDLFPAYFGLTMKELLAAKHPTAWIEFEKGHLNEKDFAAKLFNDGREYDYLGLKDCISSGYEYLEGMEDLLERLKAAGHNLHAFSNYPCWYKMIEEKLNLSQYLPWTFVSCYTGLRKPSQEAFLDAAKQLGVHPSDCIFVDDQPSNVEAAIKSGMVGIKFESAKILEQKLAECGVSASQSRV